MTLEAYSGKRLEVKEDIQMTENQLNSPEFTEENHKIDGFIGTITI